MPGGRFKKTEQEKLWREMGFGRTWVDEAPFTGEGYEQGRERARGVWGLGSSEVWATSCVDLERFTPGEILGPRWGWVGGNWDR